ncbi:MAG: transglutaminase domain-containing protein, partial [Chloroflexi bacterium]|nr:transglutaminase domain-containing protein [Chloroflexota bacterium]
MRWRFPKIPLCFAATLILTLGALPGAAQVPPFTLSSPAAYELTHVIDVSNRGPGTVTRLDLEIAIPGDVPPYQYARFQGAQGVEKSQITEKTDDEGNVLLTFHLREIPAGQSTQIKLRYLAQVYAVAYDLSPARPTGPLESSLKRYTAPEKYVESDDPAIMAKAAEVAGGFTDPVKKARAIYAYVGKALAFKLNLNKIEGAAAALRTGQGDCTEFTTLSVALLRASG